MKNKIIELLPDTPITISLRGAIAMIALSGIATSAVLSLNYRVNMQALRAERALLDLKKEMIGLVRKETAQRWGRGQQDYWFRGSIGPDGRWLDKPMTTGEVPYYDSERGGMVLP